MFRFISFKKEFLWTLEIRRIWGRRLVALQSRSSGFPCKSCFKIPEFSILPYILPTFLFPIAIFQQFPSVVITEKVSGGQNLLVYIQNHLNFAIFKSSSNLNHTWYWSENWSSSEFMQL